MWTADGWPEGWRVRWRCVCWLLIWNVDGIAEQRKPRLLFDRNGIKSKAGTLAEMDGGKLAALALA